MSSSSMIVINHLNSHYRGHQALFDLSLTIFKSQVTVIMGVSGCGKTTLLRHLVGLKPTDPGSIFVEGNDLGTFDGRQLQAYRRRVGILFQSGALFNSMTVAENIAVPLKIHSRLADETIRLMAVIKLNMVGLSDYCDFMPSQLSGGMKKRAGLARALAMDPEILFVDEPSSGLDPITAAGLDRLILDLRETLGMTIVVVTHELESAFQIADQIIVMDKGCLLAAGTPEEIKRSTDVRVVQFLRRQADEGSNGTERYLSSLLD